MKKKGFILSTYVYVLLVFFLLLLGTMLAVLNNTRLLSVKLKEQSSNLTGLLDKGFTFVLKGDEVVTVRIGTEYEEAGYTIQTSRGIDLSEYVIVDGTVDTDTLGTYKIYYRATFDGVTKELERTIHVLDDNLVTYVSNLYRYKANDNGLIRDTSADLNIRYAGNKPRNYVLFNNEKWRIIGIFEVETNSGTKERLVKIVREDSLGSMSWDSSASTVNGGYGINEWSQADLENVLNGYYIGNSSTCTYCNGYNQASCSNSCSSTVKQINSTYKNMIQSVKWNTGAITWTSGRVIPADTAYSEERSTTTGKICTSGTYCNDTVTRTTTWTGLVGLIYPSDYGYASTEISCRANIYDYTNYPCKNNNWLHNSLNYWTLSPVASSSSARSVWRVRSGGYVSHDDAYYASSVHPVLYLKSNIEITNGDGTASSPYEIAL